MRRFTQYFMITFNIKKIEPFFQFIKEKELQLLKDKIYAKMQEYFAQPETDKGLHERGETKL